MFYYYYYYYGLSQPPPRKQTAASVTPKQSNFLIKDALVSYTAVDLDQAWELRKVKNSEIMGSRGLLPPGGVQGQRPDGG